MIYFFGIRNYMVRMKRQAAQLELYYPKNTYDRLARREIKPILTNFNNLFYEAYPEALTNKAEVVHDYHPTRHSRKYDVQRAIKLCKSQKVRRKDIVEIEEYLNLQYIIEEQISYYNQAIKKAENTERLLSNEQFSSFFPELYEERMQMLDEIKDYSLTTIDKLHHDKQLCERAINDLIRRGPGFWGEASRLIGSLVAESVKQVVDVAGQSIRRK
ncbi:hypothetical protein JSQ81_14720 [Sporosarcina sp. Marseille-Q4063]|uniref:hypothetical protein n=1 Tax=Sporosarcina sp. Marseille-Q4063 TaxID=2810514 RepID=UPI001BAFA573|nr:hypothetical protein [Sporosarcina sp. Marseille-Q4063]QUW21056.1 hypothetical protein JSQ81_14720 [Sporosarcina sp. Marseille-Q4063]